MATTQAPANDPKFAALLETALTEPGRVSSAFQAFHGYSLGNQILAMFQCMSRDIPIGPIASFNRWKDLGRHVKKGEKAIELCMPITVKKGENEAGEAECFTKFIFRRNWFVMAQTEGAEYSPEPVAGWDKAKALYALLVDEVPFTAMNGNVQGYAKGRTVAINPVGPEPVKTLLHELAHIVLGHTAEEGDNRTAKDVRELEAEGVALLCGAALGLPGLEESRGYMQSWYKAGQSIPEASARRIFKVADQILKAGRQAEEGGR